MDVTDRLEAAAQHCQDPGLLHEAAATIRSLRRWLREVEDAARRAEQASAIRLGTLSDSDTVEEGML